MSNPPAPPSRIRAQAPPPRARSLAGAAAPLLVVLAAALALLLPGPARAQQPRAPVLAGRPPVAYLVTVGPGEALWERFGHSLLWIHDPAEGSDMAYNYGLFSFDQEHFVLRFVMGHMLYWMAGWDVHQQLAEYQHENRTIEIQELALGPERVRDLQSFLQWNALPRNRFYRYQYFRDNCSTRVRDALDRVLGGQLERWARTRSTDASYRDHTLRLSHGLFWASIGMDFGLGPSVDPPLSAWQAMFVPMEMQKELRSFTVRTASGDRVPFVRSERTYYQSTRPPVPGKTPRWIGPFALAGILLGALFAWLGTRALRGRKGSLAGLLSLALPWLFALGMLGTLVAFLWAVTDHVDTRWNANLLQASPLHLALAFLLWPMARGWRWARKAGRWIGAAVAVLACVGVLLKILPVVGQTNAEFVLLLVPPNLALGWVAWRMAKEGTPDAGS